MLINIYIKTNTFKLFLFSKYEIINIGLTAVNGCFIYQRSVKNFNMKTFSCKHSNLNKIFRNIINI